jgi:hypothetical protein
MGIGFGELFVLAFLLIGILGTAFWIWMIVDCATKDKDPERVIWIIVIVFTHFIGAVLYFLVRRPSRPVPATSWR